MADLGVLSVNVFIISMYIQKCYNIAVFYTILPILKSVIINGEFKPQIVVKKQTVLCASYNNACISHYMETVTYGLRVGRPSQFGEGRELRIRKIQ